MDVNGFPNGGSGGGGGGDGDFDKIFVDELCAREISVSKDKCQSKEYTLPLDGPSGEGQVIISGAGGDTEWAELPASSNVIQRRVLVEEQGLSTFTMTYDASPFYNNFFRVINTGTDPIYSQFRVCENDQIRALSYNNTPAFGANPLKLVQMSGGNPPAGQIVYNHLYKDLDISTWNDIYFDSGVSFEVWLATFVGNTNTFRWNIYIDIVSGPLGPPPVFNVQYVSANTPIALGLTGQLTKYEFQLNEKTICQNTSLRIVLESESETQGFDGNTFQANTNGNVATNLRLSGSFTSSAQGTVLPENLINHENILNIGINTHDEIDTHIVDFEAKVNTNTSNIATNTSDISNINTDINNLQNDKLNINGTNSMTGNLNIDGNEIENVEILNMNEEGDILYNLKPNQFLKSELGNFRIQGENQLTLISHTSDMNLISNGALIMEGANGNVIKQDVNIENGNLSFDKPGGSDEVVIDFNFNAITKEYIKVGTLSDRIAFGINGTDKLVIDTIDLDIYTNIRHLNAGANCSLYDIRTDSVSDFTNTNNIILNNSNTTFNQDIVIEKASGNPSLKLIRTSGNSSSIIEFTNTTITEPLFIMGQLGGINPKSDFVILKSNGPFAGTSLKILNDTNRLQLGSNVLTYDMPRQRATIADSILTDENADGDLTWTRRNQVYKTKFDPSLLGTVLYTDANIDITWDSINGQPQFQLKILPAGTNYGSSIRQINSGTRRGDSGVISNDLLVHYFYAGNRRAAWDLDSSHDSMDAQLNATSDLTYPVYTIRINMGDPLTTAFCRVEVE